MADGEVDVKVQAEGVDETSQELAEGEGGVGGVGAGGARGEGGLGRALKGGIFLAALKLILGMLPGLMEGLNAIFSILKAFLAPIGVMLLRLLTPFLRFAMTRLLPSWMSFMMDTMPLIERVANGIEAGLSMYDGIMAYIWSLPGRIWSAIVGGASWLSNGASAIGSAVWSAIVGGASWISSAPSSIASSVWSRMKQLPSMIGREIASRLPTVPSGSDAVDRGRDVIESGEEFVRDQTGVSINFSGGLGAFVEQVEQSSGVDLP